MKVPWPGWSVVWVVLSVMVSIHPLLPKMETRLQVSSFQEMVMSLPSAVAVHVNAMGNVRSGSAK